MKSINRNHKAGVHSLKTLKTALTGNFQPIYQNLAFDEYLRESLSTLKKYKLSLVDDYRWVFLQPRCTNRYREAGVNCPSVHLFKISYYLSLKTINKLTHSPCVSSKQWIHSFNVGSERMDLVLTVALMMRK